MRSVIAVVIFMLCLWAAWITGRMGYASLLSDNASKAILLSSASDNEIAAVNRAVQLTPLDPQAHIARAEIMRYFAREDEEISEFTRAVALRPRDYYLWLRLGFEQYYVKDMEGARVSLIEAVRLAPYYAQPRWWLGNALLKLGRRDEAFVELHHAVASDPTLLDSMIVLAWEAFGDDIRAIEQRVQPKTSSEYLALARSLVYHHHTDEAVAMFRTAGITSAEDKQALVTALLSEKKFPAAYEVWSSGRETNNAIGTLIDGSFENNIDLNNVAFGWQLAQDGKEVGLYLDPNEASTGARSVRLDFDGYPESAVPLVSQIVLVDPNTRYQLTFAARTKDVIALGLPVITVTDAATKEQILASAPLPRGTSGWQNHTVPFMTSGSTSAVRIALQRQACNEAPCLIYGQIWLDSFSMEKL
jgi:tetratricopeptide (TPR) repeat protein